MNKVFFPNLYSFKVLQHLVQIYIEKSSEQLGITIEEGRGSDGVGSKKGVFVSSVSENSLASQVGLQVYLILNHR